MELLEAMKKLRDDVCTGNVPFPSQGICRNLYFANMGIFLWRDVVYFISTLAEEWEYHSGNKHYPVAGCNELMESTNPWGGENGYKRLSLLNHMINKHERELRGEE